jgi:hypothetical protein
MLAALAGQASAAGIERFPLITPADNSPALRLLRRVDPSVRLALSYGVYETTVPVAALRTATEPSASAAADREEALTLGHREPKNDLSVVDH